MTPYIKRIDFQILKQYWTQVDHFKDPNKRILDVVSTLGPHETIYKNPKRQCYGLFYNNSLIGGTQIVEWEPHLIRYRTINILPEHRGKDLGWFLLEGAWKMDWEHCDTMMGWVRDTHYDWAKRHGFSEEGDWCGDHIRMERIAPWM